MTASHSISPDTPAEIVPGDVSGGTNTSHTIVVGALDALLDEVSASASAAAYEQAALEDNVLGKDTEGARWRTFRYLRELYLLRPDSLLFRALRDLWPVDPSARPLLAGLCALARDAVFRASSAAIMDATAGDALTSADLASAVSEQFPGSYGEGTLAKIGRNTFSSWEQTGHLASVGAHTKVRTRATCRPANVAYALLLGHIEGVRGQALFATLWARVLDQPTSHLMDLAASASQQGMLELRHAGGVVEVGFRELLRPFDEQAGSAAVSYVDELLAAYRKFVALPWQQNLAPPQRVWMAVYPPEHERRLRLHLPAFKAATNEHDHSWALIDITTSFETWMAAHATATTYFEEPDLLETALPAFFEHLVEEVRAQLSANSPRQTASSRSSAPARCSGSATPSRSRPCSTP